MEVLEEKVSKLEEMVMRLVYIQQKTEMEIQSLSKEMKEFKEEMRQFKQNTEKIIEDMKQDTERFKQNTEKIIAEMKQDTENLKQEMREFKDEMKEFKDEMKAFKDEMKQFKDEMREFKDEMREFKDEMKQFKDEMKEEHRKMNKQWGELANKMGTIVEDIIFPATKPVLEKYFNCEITELGMNIKKKRGNLKDEFDVIAVSEPCKTVYLIEVKATPKVEYINEFKDNKINRFKMLYPEYNDYKLVLILGSLRIEDDILNYLTKNRIYAMAYREWDYMDILNFEDLKNMGGN